MHQKTMNGGYKMDKSNYKIMMEGIRDIKESRARVAIKILICEVSRLQDQVDILMVLAAGDKVTMNKMEKHMRIGETCPHTLRGE